MEINRRGFLQVLGVTGLSLATGDRLNATVEQESDKEFVGVLYDSTRCAGCHNCEYACAEVNNLPEPPEEINGIRKLDETCRTVVNELETSQGLVPVKLQCMHCADPACVAACLTQAMVKTPEGPVIWRSYKCMGCRYCMVSCPFEIPKFEYHSPNPKIQKCSMCFENRVQNGELPACVENCPAEALVFGTRRELIMEARRRIYEDRDVYVDHIYGEHEAGGTCWMYLTGVPAKELGLKIPAENSSYPALTKGFLYSVPSVFVLVPAMLLGLHYATRNNDHNLNEESDVR